MRLSRVRFTVRRMIVALAASATLLAFESCSDRVWSGHASVPLEFLILDAPTGRPIAGASVWLGEVQPEYAASTGPDGRAKFVVLAHTAGRSSQLGSSTRSVDYEWALSVSVEGYEDVYEALKDHTRGPRYHSGEVPPPIVIRLSPEPLKL